MKAFVTIELEVSYTDEQTKEVDKILEEEGKTFKYIVVESLEELLIKEANLTKEAIKSIEVNRVD